MIKTNFVTNKFVNFSSGLGEILCVVFTFVFLTNTVFSQSSDQNFPTPITQNQIKGEIKARDIGDSRLTTYYFVFNGNRGDVFINVVANNLNGDIDIFTFNGLEPKTKITLFADSSINETGRVIYLRKPEKLLLRIQGRSPNDDSASYQIKFAGSFTSIRGVAKNQQEDLPKVSASGKAKVKVNSVGTIIEEEKPVTRQNESKNTVLEDNRVAIKSQNKDEVAKDKKLEESKNSDRKTDLVPESSDKDENLEVKSSFDPTKKGDNLLKEESKKPKVIISDPFNLDNKSETPQPSNSETKTRDVTVDLKDKDNNISAIIRIQRDTEEDSDEKNAEKSPNPLANIFLKLQLKDGKNFKRSMAEVKTMNVIKGVLTIVTHDGEKIEYSILDVVKMTIE